MTTIDFRPGDEVRLMDSIGISAKRGAKAKVVSVHHPDLLELTWVRDAGGLRCRQMDGCYRADRFAKITVVAPVAKAPRNRTRLAQVLSHLLAGKSITQGEAIVLGYGTRLAASIHDLRKQGHRIEMKIKHDLHGYPYAEYALVTRNSRNGNRKAA